MASSSERSAVEVQDTADALRAYARRARPLVVLGLGAIMIGAIFLIISLDRLAKANANEAARWRIKADQLDLTLADTRRAVSVRDWRKAERLLNIADSETGDLKKVAATLAQGDTGLAKATPPAPSPAIRHAEAVYIQFAGYPRESIAAVNRAMRAAGWKAQGGSGERLGSAAGKNEVRYRGEAERPAAEALAKAMTVDGRLRPMTARQVPIIAPNTLEVWMSR